MSRLDDLYRLHRLLDGRRAAIGRQTLLDELEVSRSKLTRLIADLRDRLGAPLVFDQEHNGYRFSTADGRYHLPGLWFTGKELHALVSLNHLLQTLQPGLLDHLLVPIRARLERILQTEHLDGGEAQRRIRVLAMAARTREMRHFQTVATAVLRFSARRARWVADETWHPEQQARWLVDGRYELSIPYSHDTELVMDILKHGAEVEVVAPEALRDAVRRQLDQAGSQYR